MLLPLAATEGTWIAQGPAPTTAAQVQNLSPNNEVAGAIHAVVAHPGDPDVLYVGTVNGGIWRTTNATAASPTWSSLTDFEQSLSIGALEMDPADPMVLLAGIGRFSSFGGDPPFLLAGGDLSGLLRSTDGGNSWTPISDTLLVGEHISCVASRGNVLLAGANNFFGGSGVGGLFRSTDTGASWSEVTGAGTGLPANRSVVDLAGDPSDASRLYVALVGNGVYRTDDTGANWEEVSDNDATLDAAMLTSTNVRLAVAQDTRVFVLVTSGSTGVTSYIGYSDDFGLSWTEMDVPGTTETALQGRDQLMGLVVDPSDSRFVYVSGITQRGPYPNSVGATSFHAHMFRGDVTRARGISSNVSSQWDHLTHQAGAGGMPNGGTASTSAPHADSRELTFDANGDLLEVDDGGVNRRTSPADNTGDWFSINGNLQVTELHSIAYDTNFDVAIGGTQDTGAIEQSAAGSATWNTVLFADGGKVAVDDSVAGTSVRYLSQQRLGNFTRRTCNPGCSNVNPALAGGVPPLVTGTGGNVQFYTPLELNSSDPARLIIGAANDVYESLDQGDTVATVPDGGANVRVNSDARMVYGHPDNADLIYVGAGSRVFVRTTAGGNLTQTSAAFPGGTVQGVAVDPADEDVAYVIDSTSVYRTDDGGDSWTDISGDIGDDGAGSFRAIAYIPGASVDRVAVGSNAGVLITHEGSLGSWFLMGANLPNAPVWDLDYDAADDVLVAGSLGRGAWLIENASTLNAPPVADPNGPYLEQCTGATTNVQLDGSGSSDPDGPDAELIYSWASDCPGGVFDDDSSDRPTLTLESPPPCPIECSVTLTVTDSGGLSDEASASVTVDDTVAPVVVAPPPLLLECNTQGGVDGSDPQILAWLALASASDLCAGSLAVTNDAPAFFPAGCTPGASTVVEFSAVDDCGNVGTASSTVTVVDTQGPVFTTQPALGDDCGYIWPPSHGLVYYDLDDTGFEAEDVCFSVESVGFSGCSSSQKFEDGGGRGDGFSQIDCAYAPELLEVRAERAARCRIGRNRIGRLYSSGLDAADTCDNVTASDPIYACVWPNAANRLPGSYRSADPGTNQSTVPSGTPGVEGSGCGSGCSAICESP